MLSFLVVMVDLKVLWLLHRLVLIRARTSVFVNFDFRLTLLLVIFDHSHFPLRTLIHLILVIAM